MDWTDAKIAAVDQDYWMRMQQLPERYLWAFSFLDEQPDVQVDESIYTSL